MENNDWTFSIVLKKYKPLHNHGNFKFLPSINRQSMMTVSKSIKTKLSCDFTSKSFLPRSKPCSDYPKLFFTNVNQSCCIFSTSQIITIECEICLIGSKQLKKPSYQMRVIIPLKDWKVMNKYSPPLILSLPKGRGAR